jgi:SSS family solute:Na+ symporter
VRIADLTVVGVYLLVMIGIGIYFLRRQTSAEEYFVGDRRMGAGHIGLSVVATDVGGGFSIGLGGLGFTMGLSGSWLLFSGLVGAWAAAVLLIPRVKELGDRHSWRTYPHFLEHRFDGRTQLAAGLISGIGYAGFVGGQILAGAKLASVAFNVSLVTATWVMALVVVVYTSFGGLQAVVLTDSIQWGVLFVGLLFLGLPLSYHRVGGLEGIQAAVPPGHLSLLNITPLKFATWMLTIIPIWFVGMTLYQRIYATRDLKTAKRAWYIAGLLEYPVMSFAGALLGLHARVLFPTAEAEMGLPLLIRDIFPTGVAGLVMAAYLSAIMSTADSCLLASVGNFVDDLYQRHINPQAPASRVLGLSRLLTVGIGVAATGLAMLLPQVLKLVLLAYAFLVSGLTAPTLAGLFWRGATATAALWSTLVGGTVAVALNLAPELLPVDPVLVALPVSALVLIAVSGLDRSGHVG